MTRHPSALIYDADCNGTSLVTPHFFEVPIGVLGDAHRIAETEYGYGTSQANTVISQMTSLYLTARNRDVVIIFNPGGWGWASISQMPFWATILNGMQQALEKMGQKVMILNYLRTTRSLSGMLGEAGALIKLSRAKGHELALQAEYLVRHLPRLKVIIAGESNGAAMAEDAMRFLRDNRRIFSVQTGTPFWAPSTPHPRSLIINHNGTEPDSFSNGNLCRIITANIQSLFGRYKGSQGNILFYIGAPGHVYNWEYSVVREKITAFLQQTVLSVTSP